MVGKSSKKGFTFRSKMREISNFEGNSICIVRNSLPQIPERFKKNKIDVFDFLSEFMSNQKYANYFPKYLNFRARNSILTKDQFVI